MRLRTKGFSLIELLVVVAVIAALSAIAIALYSPYRIKIKVSSDVNYIVGLAEQITIYYQSKGTFPTSVAYGNATFANGVATNSGLPADFSSVTWTSYSNNSIYIQTNMNGSSLGFNPTNLFGTNNLNLAVQYINGGTVYTCGVWQSGDANSIPPPYLPTWCTNTNMQACANTGSC